MGVRLIKFSVVLGSSVVGRLVGSHTVVRSTVDPLSLGDIGSRKGTSSWGSSKAVLLGPNIEFAELTEPHETDQSYSLPLVQSSSLVMVNQCEELLEATFLSCLLVLLVLLRTERVSQTKGFNVHCVV